MSQWLTDEYPWPLTDEETERFADYFDANPTWGSLHIVMEDGNVEDVHLAWSIRYAEEHGDSEGAALGRILSRLTEAERAGLSHLAFRYPFDRRQAGQA